MESDMPNKKESGEIEKIADIFISPRKVFQNINQKPTWLIPLLLELIIFAILFLMITDVTKQDQLKLMTARGMAQNNIDASQSMGQNPVMIGLQIFLILMTLLVTLLSLSGIFSIAKSIFNGEANFAKTFSVVCWSYLIAIPEEIIKTFLILSKGTLHGITISMAFFLPPLEIGQKPATLFTFLSNINPFTIWYLLLLIFGLSIINNFTFKKSSIIIGSLWVVWIIISVVLRSIFGNMFGI